MKPQNKFLLLTLSTLFLASCAKEKEYEEVYKVPETLAKSDIRTVEADGSPTKYLYVPMTLGTPRQVADANPFYQGQAKLVNLSYTKDGLEVHEIEKDDRFADNDLNKMPVLTIPGEYKEFQCKEDQYGDCTNAEEENSELEWNQKNYFVPDYASMEVKEINELDLYNIEGNDCVTPQGTKVVNTETSKDGVLNIELEKTYKLSKAWKCIRENYFNDSLSTSSFKVRFFYSLVKLENLASPDYEKLEYPIPDHDVYGFFKSEDKKLNQDYDSSRKEITYLANRWNPKKKVLNYYLSKSFNKKENAPLLKATMDSMVVMNKNLAAAGAKFRINFIQQTEKDNISPGDLRYSTIVLIDDPLANGLLGYAPTVKNPETGEILQGHVNMYGGVLKSGTRWVYEAAIDVMEEQKAKQDAKILPGIQLANEALGKVLPSSLVAQNIGNALSSKESVVVNRAAMAESVHVDRSNISKASLRRVSKKAFDKIKEARMHSRVDLKQRFDEIKSGNYKGIDELDKRIVESELSEHGYLMDGAHAPEFFPIAGTTKVVYPGLLKIKNILNKDGILKKWDDLTEAQIEEVKTVILVNRYVSTFVHEMGHSLGLRHNFAGSNDGDNFYTDKEAAELSMEKAPAYSSVMDYAFSEYNELGAFGKYDVAALMYAYAGKMQTKDGKGISVKNFKAGLKEIRSAHNSANAGTGKEIVNFAYCTDENAGLSTSCNRFDEGTSLVEIAKHKIQKYKLWYKHRNFRNGRNNFSAYDMGGYVSARYREFFQLRDIMEDYELYASIFGKELMAVGCSEAEVRQYPVCKDINDRRDAIKIVGDFFVEVIKTPDHLCAVANKDEPNKIVELAKLEKVYDDIKYSIEKYLVTSCFEDEVKAHFAKDGKIVVGEAGKFLNGFKDTNPEYKYVTDRATRGVWADKVLAYRMLFQRRAGSSTTDTEHMALIDHPEVKAKAEGILKHLVLGKPINEPVPFKTESGNFFRIPYVIGDDYKINQLEDYLYWLKRYLSMPEEGATNLTETILAQARHIGVEFEDEIDNAYETTNYVTVRKTPGYISLENRNPELNSIFTNNVTYEMGKENGLAFFMSTAEKIAPTLEKMGLEKAIAVFKRRTNPDAPADLAAEDQLFFAVNAGLQETIIGSAEQAKLDPENKLPVEAFIATFGEANGKVLFAMYEAAIKEDTTKLKAIVALKKKIMTEPAADATEEQLLLYNYELPMLQSLLQDFIDGAMSPEVFKFYNKQLRKLPIHQRYSDI